MSFSDEIINWYQQHKRDLPWRHTRDPYIIWLSEIILQQTRVEQGMPYFYRFVEHFPDVKAFAEASEDVILRHWQGLGYYSRARNMHKAAKMVMRDFGGVFPARYTSVLRLPGVGEYTAAAISSFAAGEYQAVVDGNVFRVLSRYFGVDTPINSPAGKRAFQQMAQQLLSTENPGIHNQAIMEFGAVQCRPKRPDCPVCVLLPDCRAAREGLVSSLPVKLKAKASRNRYFYYFVVMDTEGIYLQKRGNGDIWENLYELPLLEKEVAISSKQLFVDQKVQEWFGENARLALVGDVVKHVLSHQNIYAQFTEVQDADVERLKKSGWDYVLLKDLDTLAKPKLIYSFLNNFLIQQYT